jgi:hypothetical protein
VGVRDLPLVSGHPFYIISDVNLGWFFVVVDELCPRRKDIFRANVIAPVSPGATIYAPCLVSCQRLYICWLIYTYIRSVFTGTKIRAAACDCGNVAWCRIGGIAVGDPWLFNLGVVRGQNVVDIDACIP